MVILSVLLVVALTGKLVLGDPDPGLSCTIPQSAAVLPLADGDSWYNARSEYVVNEPGSGLCGTNGIVLLPDTWHTPLLMAADPPAYRSNFLLFDAFQLWVNCKDPSSWNDLQVQFGHWVSQGSGSTPWIRLSDHIASTRGNWTRVRIPLEVFVTEEWRLGGVESVRFNADTLGRECTVDNLELLSLTPPRMATPHAIAETSNIIWFNLTKRFDLDSPRNLSNYRLSSPTDQRFGLKGLMPVDEGSAVRFIAFNSEDMPVSTFRIFLKFNTSMLEGHRYDLYVGARLTDQGFNAIVSVTLNLTYTDYREVISIQVNQEGYVPRSTKVGYANGYLYDMGGLVLAVGTAGTILSRDPWTAAWSTMETPKTFTKTLRSVAALSETEAYAVGDAGGILRLAGSKWVKMPSGTTANLLAVVANRMGDCIAVGENGTMLILRFASSEWKPFSPSPFDALSLPSSPADMTFRAVFSSNDGSIVIGGDGIALVFTNQRWFRIAVPSTVVISSLAGAGQIGNAEATTMFKLDGSRYDYQYGSAVAMGMAYDVQWHGSWVDESILGDFMAVGSNGSVLHCGEDGEHLLHLPTRNTLREINCIDPDTCIAVGDGGVIYTGPQFSLSTWTAEASGVTVDLLDIAIVKPGSLRLSKNQRTISLIRAEPPYAAVAKFNLTLCRSNDPMSGGDVWAVNFTDFTVPGSYRLYLKGIGMSAAFDIKDSALTNAAWHSCRAFYYQRSGVALKEPFADPRWTHALDHEFDLSPGGRRIDAAYHPSILQSPLFKGETVCPIGNSSCSLQSMTDMAGGWFDAGDYSKYVLPTSPTLWRMLNAFEMFPEDYADDWNIPETGNGIPDLLDEVKWEMDWMEKMQTSDGGVYNKVASEMWEGFLPEVSDLGGQQVRYILPQSTEVTASYGAVMAQASRVYAQFDPVLSARYLERAVNASRFLTAYPEHLPAGGFVNPPGHISGQYYDPDDRDNRCFLAAELFRSTCNSKYALQFEEIYRTGICNFGWNDFQMFGDKAMWAYYHADCAAYAKNEGILSDIRNQFAAKMNDFLYNSAANSYMAASRMEVYYWVDWGAFGLMSNVMDLLRGLYMFPERSAEMTNAMLGQVDVTMGANPLSQSFITGVGDNLVHHPLHWTRYKEGEPVPGIGIFGPVAHMSFSNAFARMFQLDANNYPSTETEGDPLPIFRRYADTFYLPEVTEFGIGSMAAQCSILMHLKNSSFAAFQPKPTDAPSKGPTRSPTMLPSKKPAKKPTMAPSGRVPTWAPSKTSTKAPSRTPSMPPSRAPTRTPTIKATLRPSTAPSLPPSPNPTKPPKTLKPSAAPSLPATSKPSKKPRA